MIILYIGMVANLVVIMLVIISVLLIYSLLLISIEAKTFEFGVMRMTGLSSCGLITLISIQATIFVLPAIFCAFVSSVPLLYTVYHFMGNEVFDVSPLPAGNACLLALVIGLLIPALSAIIPIRRALSKNLNESITN